MKNAIYHPKSWILFVILLTYSFGALAQSITINGIVKDSTGEGIIGANVLQKGTTNGTVTDLDGNFTLTVPDKNAVLVFSFLGYVSQEVIVGNQTTLNIILKEDTQNLDEVIVIGYGTAKKSDLTGAVTRADMSALEKSPNVNVLQGLKGVVPGLNIGVATKAGDSPTVSIRGRNSISGSTEPLVVLDGVIYRGNISDINPSDIESIDVLKDASSTAIYGSQAANGVLMITTKTAKNYSKPIFEYNGTFTLQGLINNDMKRLDRERFATQIADIMLENSRMGNDLSQRNPDFNPTDYFKDEAVIKGYNEGLNTDWWNLLTEDVPYIQNHNVSVRGKTEMNSYFISFGFTDQKNLVINDTYKRYNVRINLDSKTTDWLKIGTSSYFNVSNFSGENTSFGNLFSIPACTTPYEDDGVTLKTNPITGTINPLLKIHDPNKDIRYNLSGNVYADVTIPWIKGLSYRINYANNWTIYHYYAFDPYANTLLGQAEKKHTNQNEWTLDNILTYQNRFGKHSVNATFVYGVEKRTYEATDAIANTFNDKTLGYNNMGMGQADLNTISSNAWKETSLYNMLRLVYTFNDRYIFTGTIRRDGFSGFSEGNKFGYFPSIAGAWRLSEENFIKNNLKWIDNLKLRLSYGTSGNRTSGRYATMAQMQNTNNFETSSTGYVFGDGGTAGLMQLMKTLPNPDLKWETTKSVNIGLDFSVLNGRLFGNYEYYVSNTTDLLYDIEIPNINGMVTNSVPTNIGKLQNMGHEFSITGIPVTNKDFEWSITANFSLNRNKVKTILGIDANGDGKEDDLIASNIFINQPLNTIYDYNIIGMWQMEDYLNGIIPNGFTYGTYKIEDINQDGSYTAEKDRKIIGCEDPLYRFSIQNNFRYKDFELNIFINSVQGGKNHYLGQPLADLSIPDHLKSNSFMKFDYWTPENPNAKYRQLGFYTASLGEGFSPYVSRSFIRLQELSLAYNVPQRFLKKIHVNRAKVFVSASNLFTITNWDGWDPEAGQGVTYDLDGYPTMKSYTLGLNFEF
ncbi:TonB-dependent receptor [uncultured Bacteroides sp.]|jgi:TonB-linked SusC/RagA family outer membrane protein|uniref:SusC/RagA family TonB-linked outer membrane protein n=1 Tax=uncultured Bacteroides sp. TaxID=162156 RepID=UPI00280B237D|nr:TonB-dependent receptor [uncultured Bacteroides sp.]